MSHFRFVFLALSTCCCMSQNEEPSGFLNTLDKVAYIEERNKGEGMWYGNFGDLVVLDLSSGSKTYVTRDTYYDDNPVWSPDGGSIAWLTKRSGSEKLLRIQGVSIPYEIFIHDLASNRSHRFGLRLVKRYPEVMNGFIANLKYSHDGASLFFRSPIVGDPMYEVPLDEDTIRIITGPPKVHWFSSMVVAPGLDTVFLRFERYKSDSSHAALSNSKFSFLKEIPAIQQGVRIGNWASDGSRLIGLADKIYIYDRLNDSVTTFPVPWNPEELLVKWCYYTQTNKIVFFGEEIIGYPEGGGAPNTAPREVYVYDKDGGTLRQITNDGLQKYSLSSCVIAAPWLKKYVAESEN